MAKGKTKETSYYNPKKGVLCEYKPSKKSPICEYIDIVSKLKTETLEIRPDFVRATDDGCSIKVLLKLGVDCEVDRKEFKKIIKHIDSEFSTKLMDNQLIFSWGEGSSTSIEVKENPEPKKVGLGQELDTFYDNEFYHSLFVGGYAADPKFNNTRLGFIHYDGEYFTSTDNIMLSTSIFCTKINSQGFLIGSRAFQLWRDINLPTKYIVSYENGIRIMLRDDVVITNKTNHYTFDSKVIQMLLSKLEKLERFSTRKFKIPNEVWKKLKMFKGSDEITIKNNEIYVGGSSNLRTPTNLVPFESDLESFSVKTDKFFNLKDLVTEFSDFSILSINVGSHTNKYILVEPDPDMDDKIILGGLAEERENAA